MLRKYKNERRAAMSKNEVSLEVYDKLYSLRRNLGADKVEVNKAGDSVVLTAEFEESGAHMVMTLNKGESKFNELCDIIDRRSSDSTSYRSFSLFGIPDGSYAV